MLRAINSINNQSIHATSRTERLDTYVCPFCKAKVIVKKGQIMVPHFAHAIGVVNSCTYNEYIKSKAGGESEEHLKYKLMIKEKAEAREDVERVELEVRIGNRIADTMIYYKNGSRQIVEIQLSPITIDKLEERSSDYVKEGIDPYYIFWYFGEKNKWFSKENSPVIPELRTWNYGVYKERKEQKERERRERDKREAEEERIRQERRKVIDEEIKIRVEEEARWKAEREKRHEQESLQIEEGIENMVLRGRKVAREIRPYTTNTKTLDRILRHYY